MPPLRTKKTKTSRFPVARIKKIMQLDEEVGKLASSVPVMMSKSLECFMQLLIDETCKETAARGSKKIAAYHLKHMINSNPNFDFLRDLVESIPDPAQTEAKAGPSKPRKVSATIHDPSTPSAPTRRKRVKKEKQDTEGEGNEEIPPENGALPAIGTWKRDPVGGGGTGEGGRGMFDDYEDDDDY